MTAQEEINQAFNKFVYDRIENDFIDEIVKLELWKSQEISIKKSESNEVFRLLICPYSASFRFSINWLNLQ